MGSRALVDTEAPGRESRRGWSGLQQLRSWRRVRSRRRMRVVILLFLALLLPCKHGRVRAHERVHSLVHREGERRLGGRLEGRRELSALGREYDRPCRSLITSVKHVELIIRWRRLVFIPRPVARARYT
jgi:hypothetical protein